MEYIPKQEILERYAKVLVNFALNSGNGIKPGEVVLCNVPDIAKPLLKELQIAILKSGGRLITNLIPTGLDADYYLNASDEQLKFFPKEYLKERVKLIDHTINIYSINDIHELEKVNHEKILLAKKSKKEYAEWLTKKEQSGKYTWTIALWGTEAMASEVGLTIEQYWEQIISACFLDQPDPITNWKNIYTQQFEIRKKLNELEIVELKVIGEDSDLKIKLGIDRVWNGGSGRNIPSFEIFTSPDWRGTEGWIKLNQPLYRDGHVIKDIRLEFVKGRVVSFKAGQGEKYLENMLLTSNADKLGEFSLTDKRFSRIHKFMANTLYDENIGGTFGNTHIALGRAYLECYRGDVSKLTPAKQDKLGFNNSVEHCDVISTTDRTVIATTSKKKEIIIYEKGEFTI